MQKLIGITLFVLIFNSGNVSAQWIDLNKNGKKDAYEDTKNSVDIRVSDLLQKMTLQEKISQMGHESPAIDRLGIGQYTWWNSSLHGIVANDDHYTTVFPQSIGLASTWDLELVRKEAIAISDESRALANMYNNKKYLNCWDPMINMARDPRWGRTQEGYGEDPFLVSCISLEYVKGLQGNDKKYFKTLATPKHFALNNEDWNRHFVSADVDEKILHDYYLPAFKKCITEGNAQSIMAAYNAVNGVPCSCNEELLVNILRGQWGFKGHVVSDCGAIYNIYSDHKYVKTAEEAVALSVKRGTDLDCGSEYVQYLKPAREKKDIDDKFIDIALSRMLKSRFQLGMFDPREMVPYSSIDSNEIDSKEHRNLARQVAQESIILLKNEPTPGSNTNFLPLSKDIKSIAVIGPNAYFCQFGDYSGKPSYEVTPLQGIKNKVSINTIVQYALGADSRQMSLPVIESKFYLPPDTENGKHGLKGEYYNNLNFEGNPVLTRIDTTLNFNWLLSSPDTLVNIDQFSVRWTGKIVPDKSGRYMISADRNVTSSEKDKGIRVYLDGELIIDQWNDHLIWSGAISKELIAGNTYDIRIDFIDDIDWAGITFGWKWIGKDPLNEAVELAKKSDVVILVVGLNKALEGELRDRTSLDLPTEQRTLIRKVFEANPHTVLTLVNGSPVSINWENENIPAIIEAWYPGQEGGNAIADVIFGDYNPGGKLPVTFYTGINQLPDVHDYDVTKGRTYMYFKKKPLYPFGYGLSYTQFKVVNPSFSGIEFTKDDTIQLSFEIQNVGAREGSEVMQLYIHEQIASKYTVIKALKAFKRIFLQAGEKKHVTFSLPVKELATYNVEKRTFIIIPGTYDIMVGNSSDNIFSRNEIIVKE